jgi:hypothetical protein
MWVLFVKLLSPRDWWLDPKPVHDVQRSIEVRETHFTSRDGATPHGAGRPRGRRRAARLIHEASVEK